jgi:hypothetical protein
MMLRKYFLRLLLDVGNRCLRKYLLFFNGMVVGIQKRLKIKICSSVRIMIIFRNFPIIGRPENYRTG